MQFFNCIIQSILQFISLETKISMSKSLEFSDFKFQFWQNLTQPKATLDTLCRLLWSLVWPVQCGGKPFTFETTISISKSLEFSDFKFQFWQNLLQPEATLDTLWSALELSMACAGQRKASFQGQYHQRAKKHAQNCMFLGLCVLRARDQRKTRICNI